MSNLDDRFRDEDELHLDDIDDLDLIDDEDDEDNYDDEVDDLSTEEDLLNTDNPMLTSNDVGVAVKCEVGQLQLTLNELLQLKIGSVLEITKWPNSVKLSVNGNYFAEGQLVEINNFLGVKITKRLNAHNK